VTSNLTERFNYFTRYGNVHFNAGRLLVDTSISANADEPRDSASHKIHHIALHAECNNQNKKLFYGRETARRAS